MTEHPLTVDAREAKGLHDGSISVLVRVMEPQPKIRGGHDGHGTWSDMLDDSGLWAWYGRCMDGYHRPKTDPVRCPFGVPGDRLFIKEEWYYDVLGVDVTRKPPDCDLKALYFRADGECCQQIPECCCGEVGPTPWASPEQMPRWAARTLLEVKDVKVVRVQEISEEDAIAAGVQPHWEGEETDCMCFGIDRPAACNLMMLHDDTWDANKWVWLAGVAKVEQDRKTLASKESDG